MSEHFQGRHGPVLNERLLNDGLGKSNFPTFDVKAPMPLRTAVPPRALLVSRNAGITGVREENGSLVVGAATSGVEIEAHPGMNKAWPGIVEAVDMVVSTEVLDDWSQIGGQRATGRASGAATALCAAGAVAVVIGHEGPRDVPVEEIATRPDRKGFGDNEFILEFKLPPRPPRSADAYLRFIPRTEMDIAVVDCGINVTLDSDGICVTARAALGGVAPTVLLVEEMANALVGHTLDDATLQILDKAAQAACRPIPDNRGTVGYRTKVAGVLARRVAAIAFDRALRHLCA